MGDGSCMDVCVYLVVVSQNEKFTETWNWLLLWSFRWFRGCNLIFAIWKPLQYYERRNWKGRDPQNRRKRIIKRINVTFAGDGNHWFISKKKIENRKSEVSWWFELCVRLVTSTEIIVVHFFLANGASNGTNKNTEPKNLQNWKKNLFP